MWEKLKAFFKRSETILWARLNALIGFLAVAATYVDPSLIQPILTPQNFAIYIFINGVATEYLRRRRAPNLGKPE